MQYVALMNSDRVLQDFRQEKDDYKLTEKQEILLSRRLFVVLSTAYYDSEQTLIIKAKSGVSCIKSLDDVYLMDAAGGKEATVTIYLAGYQDNGAMLRLVTVRESSNREKYNESLFIPVTHAVYDALRSCRDLVRQGIVYSLKSDSVISLEDLKLVNSSGEAKSLVTASMSPASHRSVLELKAKDLLISRLNITVLMDFYQFILLNNRLANVNIHPTPDSIGRLISESKDVNKGLLLQIRDVMDNMQQYADVYALYTQLMQNLQSTDDVSAMDKAYNKYLRQFQG